MSSLTPQGPGSVASIPLFQNESALLTGGMPAGDFLVAINGQNHYSASSSDAGDTWTQDGSFAGVVGTTFGGVAYSPALGRLSILEAQNNVPDASYSDDLGVTWHNYTAINGNNEYRMAFCFGAYFVGGTAGIWSSTTGKGGWAQIGGTVGPNFGAWFEPSLGILALAGGNAAAPRTFYSTDGVTFTAGNVAGMVVNQNLYAITYDRYRGKWFAMNAAGRIYSTPDIINGPWTSLGVVAVPAAFNVSAIAFIPGGNGKIIAAVSGNGLYTSANDGVTFNIAVGVGTFNDVIYSTTGKLVAVGSKIYNSPDGVTWTDRTGALAGTFTAIARIA